MNRDWTEQVRKVLASARPVETLNSGGLAASETARIHAGGPSRAADRHEIRRIAHWYGWQAEIDRVLLAAGVASLAGLDDPSVGQLLLRMTQLEACAQEGLDSPDAPPAR